jgi:hypothetical protein
MIVKLVESTGIGVGTTTSTKVTVVTPTLSKTYRAAGDSRGR